MVKPRHRKVSLSEIQESVVASIGEDDSQRLKLFICCIPILGFFPALWFLYRGNGNREEKSVSRLVVALSFVWILSVTVINTGAQTINNAALPLMVLSTFLTSSYFVTNLWLMMRLWQRKRLKMPFISRLGDRLP